MGFDLGEFENLLRTRGERNVAEHAGAAAAADHLLELKTELLGVDAEAFETTAGFAGGKGEDRTEDVFGAHIRMVELAGGGDGAFEGAFGIGRVIDIHGNRTT